MKILIAYYSRTNNTRALAEKVREEFEKKGHQVDVEEVRPAKEHSFWGWWHIRYFLGEYDIRPSIITDASKYDAICIGSPNWTRLSLPMAKYLKNLKGVRHKNISLFSTTALIPSLEWYFFSAYLLDLTFNSIVEEKGGRVITSMMLSGWVQSWGVNSDYGKRAIKQFCHKMETPILSFKNYILQKKEIEGARLLIIIFSMLLLFLLIFQVITYGLNFTVFSWGEYLVLSSVMLGTCFLILIIMERQTGFSLAKYIGGISAVIICTLIVLYVEFSFGRYIILGYVLVLAITGLFRDPKAVLVAGITSVLGYIYLIFNYSLPWVLIPQTDIVLLGISTGIIGIITNNLQNHFIALVGSQEEMEMARVGLEIRVGARTEELKRLAEVLEQQVKQRTHQLEEKVQELERFHKFTVGREVRMIELKNRIKELEGKLGKTKKGS